MTIKSFDLGAAPAAAATVNSPAPALTGAAARTVSIADYLSSIHAVNANVISKVGAYVHGATADSAAYTGGVYCPTQNRIYLMPYAQANQANWHYIDCSDGSVNAYAHGVTAVNSAYIGGVYSPTENKIYFVPLAQANQANWHYIDCSDGSANAYAHGATAVASAYLGGAYSPTQDRIYFAPFVQGAQASWHFIQIFGDGIISRQLAAHTVFNKL